MASVSIAEAARLSGRDRRTIERYLQNGKLSSTTTPTGGRSIDVSELVRVFGQLSLSAAPDSEGQSRGVSQSAPQPDNAAELAEMRQRLAVAEVENAQLRERLQDKDKHIEHIAQAMRLLEHKPGAAAAQAPRRWWPFGKGQAAT